MNKITLIGLGLDEGDITLNALNALKDATCVVARTGDALSFKTLKNLNINAVTLDEVYKKSRNFDTLNKNLAKQIIELAKTTPVVYAVDGSVSEDASCKAILQKCKNVQVFSGVSATTKCLERLKISQVSICGVSAYDYINGFKATYPLVIYALDSREIASQVKLMLGQAVGEEVGIFVTDNKGSKKVKVYELDRLKNYDYSTCAYIENKHFLKKQRFEFSDLIDITKALRGENGCPWDREQTPKSIEKNLIEETYELIEAIESDDDTMIIEELGDVMLQTAFYLVFGEENGRYDYYDVLSGICSKLISRHTHVFGTDKAKDSESALDTWNKNKAVEKGYQNGTEYLKSVPKNFPSVMRAQKVGSRAGKQGFDFENENQVIDKIYEEINEVKLAIDKKDKEEIKKECGDLLFSVVNLVRKLDVDGETALNYSTEKFITRFSRLEQEVEKRGLQMNKLTQTQLDDIYNSLKQTENK